MNKYQKGLTPILALVLVAAVGFVLFFVYKNFGVKNIEVTVPITSPIAISSPILQSTIDTKDWKIYTNEKYGFSFQYPDTQYYNLEKTTDNEDYLIIDEGISFILTTNDPDLMCDGVCYINKNSSKELKINNISFIQYTGSSNDPNGRVTCKENCVVEYLDVVLKISNGRYLVFQTSSTPSKREATTETLYQILSSFKFTN